MSANTIALGRPTEETIQYHLKYADKQSVLSELNMRNFNYRLVVQGSVNLVHALSFDHSEHILQISTYGWKNSERKNAEMQTLDITRYTQR